ncbi:MAG: NAD(P)-dependent oxidoreductase [Dehalococcoidales bacterium]
MGRKARVGITRDMFDRNWKPLTPGPGLKLLDEMPEVEYQRFSELLPEVTPAQVHGFDMVITLKPKWTQNTFAGDDQFLCVHRNGVGYDMVDVPALTKAGVMLCITPAAVRRPVANAILTFILALSTRLLTKDKVIRQGKWGERDKYHGIGLRNKTLGSIGVGNIGHEVFKLVKPFGMKHIACDPYVTQETVTDVDVKLVDMDTVLAESDFLNISCMLNEETHHLVGEKELRKMKKTAFLINTARGPIVDEAALIKALQEGWIQGAGIDVFEQEPTPPDNPLLKMGNVIVTPHALSWTGQTFMDEWSLMLKQISQIIRGEMPEGLVNREVWDMPQFQSKLKKFLESIR